MTPARYLLPVQAMQLTAETCAAIHEWVGAKHDFRNHDHETWHGMYRGCGARFTGPDEAHVRSGEWLCTDGTRWWVTAEQPGVTDDEAFREHWLAEMARATPEGGAS